jgi:hypothetical protein
LSSAKLREHATDAPGPIHLIAQAPKPVGVTLSRVDHGLRALKSVPRQADRPSEFVTHATLDRFGQVARTDPLVPSASVRARLRLTFFGCVLLTRFQGIGDRNGFARKQILPLGVLVGFTTKPVVKVDDVDRHVSPAQTANRFEPTAARDQAAVRGDDHRVQEPHLGNAGRQRRRVTKILPEPIADQDPVDRPRL